MTQPVANRHDTKGIVFTLCWFSCCTDSGPRNKCRGELRIAAESGRINPTGILHAGLVLSAKLLKLHVVLMESINSMLSNLSKASRNISLELLSARTSLRKRLGFMRQAATEDAVAHAIQSADEDDLCESHCSIAGPGPSIQKNVKMQKLIKPHTTIISALSMKEVKPFALQAMKELKIFGGDVAHLSQDMFRYATPDPLTSLPENNFRFLNHCDRPFATLLPNERKIFTLAQQFHKQWFQYKKENFHGKPSILCFFLAGHCPPLFDARKAFRIFFVGEVVHSQVACHNIIL